MEVNQIPEIVKISPVIFNELIFSRLRARNENVPAGCQHGVDVGIVAIENKVVPIYN